MLSEADTLVPSQERRLGFTGQTGEHPRLAPWSNGVQRKVITSQPSLQGPVINGHKCNVPSVRSASALGCPRPAGVFALEAALLGQLGGRAGTVGRGTRPGRGCAPAPVRAGPAVLVGGRGQRQTAHGGGEVDGRGHRQGARVLAELTLVGRQTRLDHGFQAVDKQLGIVQVGLARGEGASKPPQSPKAAGLQVVQLLLAAVLAGNHVLDDALHGTQDDVVVVL